MFEKDSEWNQFRRLLIDTNISTDDICRHTQIPAAIVGRYMDQFHADAVLAHEETTIPPNIRPFAVGFRYLRNNRWMNTEAEQKARRDHDAGIMDVCQGKAKVKGEDAYILYAIPRKARANKRRLYFSAQVFS